MGFVKKAVKGVTGAIGAGQQSSMDPYQFRDEAFELSPENQEMMDQDRGIQSRFIEQLNKQIVGYDPLIDAVSARARGEGPSLAQSFLDQAMQKNLASQVSSAVTNKAVNPAIAARNAARVGADINQEAAGQGTRARMQEVNDAISQEIAARGAQSSTTSAGGNLSTQARTQGMDYANTDRDAQIERERLEANQRLGSAGINSDRFNSGQTRRGQLVSQGGQALASVLMSDENVKEDIKPAKMDDFLDKLEPISFSYKDDPKGEKQLGIKAQDLMKSKVGKNMVVDTEKGKGVDMAKAVSAMLASNAHLHKKMKEMGKK